MKAFPAESEFIAKQLEELNKKDNLKNLEKHDIKGYNLGNVPCDPIQILRIIHQKEIANKINLRMKELKITNEQLAEMLGKNDKYISSLRSGRNKITDDMLKRIAECLECSPESLGYSDPSNDNDDEDDYDELNADILSWLCFCVISIATTLCTNSDSIEITVLESDIFHVVSRDYELNLDEYLESVLWNGYFLPFWDINKVKEYPNYKNFRMIVSRNKIDYHYNADEVLGIYNHFQAVADSLFTLLESTAEFIPVE